MKTIRFILLPIIILLFVFPARAYESISFHCDGDTTLINTLLASDELKDMTPNQRIAFFAKKLVGSPSSLREEVLDAESAPFCVNVHSFTPLSLISTCVALSQAYETSSAPNWRDFAEKFEGVMYKGGKAGDFISKFIYPSDWIADNIFRGNVEDASPNLDGLAARRKERSIDYISHHRDSFKALSDQATYDRLKMLEMGFRNHQIIYVSNGDLTNSGRFKQQAKEGDIFFLLSTDFNLDSREMGILTFDGNQLKIIQLSPMKESVTLEELPFEQYVKRNIKRIQGARIIRIAK